MHWMMRAGVAVAALALIPVVDTFAAPYGSRALRQGTNGSDVRALQRHLDKVGYETSADGEFSPATARSVRSFETDEERRANGVTSTYEQRLVRSRGEEHAALDDDPTAPATDEGYLDDDGLAVAPASAPEEVKAIIEAGNEIATEPYEYGGGHGRRLRDSGYDCSGSISYVLRAAGLLDVALDSLGLARWGEPGRGEWVTVRANAGHAYMIVANLRFDTSARKRTGSRWSETMRSARGYRGRHPEGL